MFFPASGVECNPVLPLGVAFAISLVTATGGISGAFLLLPFQLSVLGYVQPGVSATNQFYNILACPSGVWKYYREGRLLWPLALLIALGTIPGVFLGAVIRLYWLPQPGRFFIFAALVLLYMAGVMTRRLYKARRNPAQKKGPAHVLPLTVCQFSLKGFSFIQDGASTHVSSASLLLLSGIVGIIGGIYGVGGGALMSPFLVGWLRLPVHAIAGATLLGTFLTSIVGIGVYSALAPLWPALNASPDYLLGGLLGIGGMAGMYCGASLQKFIPAFIINTLLCLVLLGLGLYYLFQAL